MGLKQPAQSLLQPCSVHGGYDGELGNPSWVGAPPVSRPGTGCLQGSNFSLDLFWAWQEVRGLFPCSRPSPPSPHPHTGGLNTVVMVEFSF